MRALRALVERELHRPVAPVVRFLAQRLAHLQGGDAVLFYGSALHADDPDAVLDFYVLRAGDDGRRHHFWPDVSYHEMDVGGRVVRAKVATMPLATFEEAARGNRMDTTIWTRFAQPSRLIVPGSGEVADRVGEAICACVRTASQFAAALGPREGAVDDYWHSLFRQTYGAELRIETQDRAAAILMRDLDYFRDVLPLAWSELGLIGPDGMAAATLRPAISEAQRRAWLARWHRRKIAGKPLNLLRLVKAAWTFEGAARYALWKIERHSGVAIPLTPWRERHPLLAAPGVLLHLWRASDR